MSLWNKERTDVHGWLTDLEPSLGDLYWRSVDLLEGEAGPEVRRATLSLVGHCLREVINRLPDALGDAHQLPSSRRGEEHKARNELVEVYRGVLGSDAGSLSTTSGTGDSERRLETVPAELVEALDRYIKATVAGEANRLDRDSIVVAGAVDRLSPALGPWTSARLFFMKWTHIEPTSSDRSLPTMSVVIEHLEAVETALRIRLGAFFDSFDELEDLVAKANEGPSGESLDGVNLEGFRVPDDAEVKAALLRLGRLPLRRHFYVHLANPQWLKPLAAHDAFRSPPPTVVTPDALIRSEPWPEMDYLVRMSEVASSDVADVLVPLAEGTNQWLRRGIVQAATRMVPSDAAKFVPSMKKWPEDRDANLRIDSRALARLIARLLRDGEHPKGMQLAEAFLKPTHVNSEEGPGREVPVAGVESYAYGECLEIVGSELGSSRLAALARWLAAFQEASGHYYGQRGADTSFIWRPSIANGQDLPSDEIGDVLVEEFRSSLADEMTRHVEIVETYIQHDQPLFRRIAVHVVADALAGADLAACTSPREASTVASPLIRVAQRIVEDETLLDSTYRSEYVRFIRACLGLPGLLNLEPLFDAVREGPTMLRGRWERQSGAQTEGAGSVDADVRDSLKRWQHALMSGLRHEKLPSDLRDLMTRLDGEFGSLEPSAYETRVRGFVGPTGPRDASAMSAMRDEELIEYLRSWHPDPAAVFGPSHEGQGRVLQEIASSSPDRLLEHWDDVLTLRPTYIRHIVQGWEDAVKEGRQVPQERTVALVEWMMSESESLVFTPEGDPFDDDRDLHALQSAVLGLVNTLLEMRSNGGGTELGAGPPGPFLEMLEAFASHSEPSPEYEDQYGGENMDPLTLSLNTMRPVAIRALTRIAHRYPASSAAQRALDVLESHIDRSDPSLAVAAVFGEATGRLYSSQPEWIEKNAASIYGAGVPPSEWQQVALSTALAVYPAHPKLLELLRSSLEVAIEQISKGPLRSGWRGRHRSTPQLIGDWLLESHVTGRLASDDALLEAWYSAVDARQRGDVLGHLGWKIMRTRDIDDAILTRAASLWERRVSHVRNNSGDAVELSGAYWLARSDKFPVDWWLPQLEFASLVIPNYDTHGMVGDRLAIAAQTHPDLALKVLENILLSGESVDAVSHYDLMEHAAPRVIAEALCHEDEALQRRANDLMNALGATGYIGLRERVRAHRAEG